MAKQSNVLFRRGNKKNRTALARKIREIRALDRGKGAEPYNDNRTLDSLPFSKELINVINNGLKSRGKIRLLDKGTGTGRLLSGIKTIDPSNIHITSVSASRTINQEYAPSIDSKRIGIGLRARHAEKFDIILDAYSEDYHLNKRFVALSIEKSIKNLRPGGCLFTILPLVYLEKTQSLSMEEGRKIASALSKRKDIKVKAVEIKKRFERIEYIDLVLIITKK